MKEETCLLCIWKGMFFFSYYHVQDLFSACRMAFTESDTSKMSLMDKSDLFFYDYSMHPLFVHENYIHASPHHR